MATEKQNILAWKATAVLLVVALAWDYFTDDLGWVRWMRGTNSGEEVSTQVIENEAEVSSSVVDDGPVAIAKEDVAFVCRAAIAAIMFHPVSIVNVTEVVDGVYFTKYIRPDDGKEWKNACRLNGHIVEWAMVEDGKTGRWRNSPGDDVITYKLDGTSVVISQSLAGGGNLSDTFKRE